MKPFANLAEDVFHNLTTFPRFHQNTTATKRSDHLRELQNSGFDFFLEVIFKPKQVGSFILEVYLALESGAKLVLCVKLTSGTANTKEENSSNKCKNNMQTRLNKSL